MMKVDFLLYFVRVALVIKVSVDQLVKRDLKETRDPKVLLVSLVDLVLRYVSVFYSVIL